MKIKIEVDGLSLEHATELTKFLSSLKPLPEDEERETFSIKGGQISVDKTKTTRKKAEKEIPEYPKTVRAPYTTELKVVDSKEEEEAYLAGIKEIPTPEKVENIKVVEPEVLNARETISLMQIRSLVAQKAGEHKDSIKAKLVELGAQNVSTLDAKHFQTIFDFLTEL